MIEKITIKNFQKHRFFETELDPGVTTLVGDTERGKSAILRALRWFTFNRPAGDSFVRYGASECLVEVVLEGVKVGRSKGKEGNCYFLGNEKYVAFGQEVPEDITKILNLDSDNFQRQHDSPFWLTESPGEVAKKLNRIVDLSQIDSTLAALVSEVRKAQAEVEHATGRFGEVQRHLERLEWCQGAHETLTALEAKQKSLDTLERRLNSLESMWQEYQEIEKTLEQSTIPEDALDTLGELVERLQRGDEKLNCLVELQRKLKLEDGLLESFQKILDETEKKLAEFQGICPLCGREMRVCDDGHG